MIPDDAITLHGCRAPCLRLPRLLNKGKPGSLCGELHDSIHVPALQPVNSHIDMRRDGQAATQKSVAGACAAALYAILIIQASWVQAQVTQPTAPLEPNGIAQPAVSIDPLPEHEGPAPEPESHVAACTPESAPENTMLERMRRRLTVSACASSAWIDSLFGDELRYDQYRATYGTVSAGALWSDYDGLDPRLRFRVRLQLPQWDERISAFAGRVGEEDYVSDSEGDFDALPTRQFGNIEDESVLVGLGYSSSERTGNDFDAGVGVRVDLPLDPYARGRYEVVRILALKYVLRARETVFWQNSEGFGSTARLTIDRALTDKLLLRWSGLGKFTEETIGLEWNTQLTLFQSLGARTGLAYQAQTEGATDNEVQITRHSARVILRRQLTPEWLFLEVRAGVGWPRLRLVEKREAGPELGVALEMQFGEKK